MLFKLSKLPVKKISRMHPCVVLGLHMEDLVADALPDVPLPAAPDSHQSQPKRVAQARPSSSILASWLVSRSCQAVTCVSCIQVSTTTN